LYFWFQGQSDVQSKNVCIMGKKKERKRQRRLETYKLAINARKNIYDNFNKWMTYYYVAVGATFIAYYSNPADEELKSIII